MSQDRTTKDAFITDSIKKFFVDTFETGQNIPVTFDRGLAEPDLTIWPNSNKWIGIQLGYLNLDTIAEKHLTIYPCTRQDPEYWELARLSDTLVDELVDVDHVDGCKRITLYDSSGDTWSQITKMVIYFASPITGNMDAEDETKFRMLNILLRWGAVI